jgi:hypothetical protein
MTRKEFTIIAAALLASKPIRPMTGDPALHLAEMRTWTRMIRKMTDALDASHPHFNRERFVAACGFHPTEG